MTTDIAALVSDNLDIWTTTVERKSSAGRGGGKKISLYGIECLRGLILDLAVRGKLVPQDENEEAAEKLLAKIAKARKKKIDSGLVKAPKSITPLRDALNELPTGWSWTQLGAICEISPTNKAEDNLDASFVPMACVTTRIDGVHEAETRKWGEIKKGFTHIAEGDIGLAKITPCFENGKAAIFQGLVNGIGAGTTELHVARPWSEDINRRYLLLTMKTPSYLREGEVGMTGTAGQKRVTRSYFEATPIALPPLAEQQRIVAKVDELMALCDALEEQSAAAMAAQQTLVETLLATLTSCADADDLASNWTRLEAHFDTLFTTDASVNALKQALLGLAVRGKLTEQMLDDGSASVLLREIREHSAKRAATGRMRASFHSAPIKAQDRPFELPSGWVFARLGEVLINRDAERVPVSAEERAGRKGEFDYYGASGVIDKVDGYIFDEALLLIGEDGANLINRSTPIAFIATGKYWVNNHAHVLEAKSNELLRYMELYVNAIDLKPYVTGTAQPKMNQAKMNAIIVALPPACEIIRIVAKVDKLMALCDALKSHLSSAAETQKHLADTIIEQAAA